MNRLLLLPTLLLLILTLPKQNLAQKRELRAAWVATVANIDWPSTPDLNSHQQKLEFLRILDSLHSSNFNAIVVQVRPTSDAFYPSPLEPWSKYLTGKSGQAPSPYYDPLKFMIEETHKRNMEFHAWINPLRAYNFSNPHPSSHISKQHPDWFYTYGNNTIMNAGNPEAANYLLKVIEDIVVRYDIDALHMDDYFYPYTIRGKSINDFAEYQKYNPRNLSLDDWRRDNINRIIKRIHDMILAKKPSVQFGISPFGVWRNYKDDPRGSKTNAGQTNYDNLYADILLWMKSGWIDYCAPQLYWERGHSAADYNELVKWWKKNSYDTYIIAGLQIYLMEQSTKSVWKSTAETLAQIYLAEHYNYDGIFLYSAKYLVKNIRGLKGDLKQGLFSKRALPLIHKHSDHTVPQAPTARKGSTNGWNFAEVTRPISDYYYVLAYETPNDDFVIEDINGAGRFHFRPKPKSKYFLVAVNKNQRISTKVYL